MGVLNKLKEMILGETIDYTDLISKGAIVVDVRIQGEFKSGHIQGSKNIPLNEISAKLDVLKGKEVILVCRSGARSGQAKSILTSNGIHAHNAGAWQTLARS